MRDALLASRTALAALPAAGLLVFDRQLIIVHAEGELFVRFGREPCQLVGARLEDALGAERWAVLAERCRAALGGEQQSFDRWEGETAHWVQITPVRDECGEVTAAVAVLQEVTERVRANEALERSESRLREAERMVGVGSFELDFGTAAVTYSEGFARLLAADADGELSLSEYMDRVHPDDRARVARIVEDVRASGGSDSCEYRIIRPDGVERRLLVQGEVIPDAEGSGAGVLRGAALDVTDEREAEHERLEAASLFQRGFDDAPIGMMIVDPIDARFVRVNDSLCRLLARPREELLGMQVEEVTHPGDRGVVATAQRKLGEGGHPNHQAEKRYMRPDGSVVWVSAHITTLSRSDGSLRAFFGQIFDITERKEREQQYALEAADAVSLARIRSALDSDRLTLYSQPVIDLATGEPVQQELLLRMIGEDGSIVSPCDFLPVAERYGLISEIDRWVIRQAVAMAAAGVASQFNLSGLSIGDPDVLREIEGNLASTGADPSLLVVEVTETAVMDRVDNGRAFIERLRALGCCVALDDFGTGFSGLAYLKHLPAQHLKIDIEYVHDASRSEAGERMVRGIVGLAREFNLTTTAEGVEDEHTCALLRELGVDRAQGYYFGRPQPLA